MTVYITIGTLTSCWGYGLPPTKRVKPCSVQTLMTALNLQDIDPEHIPEEVKQAGAFIASVAAAGNLYQQKQIPAW